MKGDAFCPQFSAHLTRSSFAEMLLCRIMRYGVISFVMRKRVFCGGLDRPSCQGDMRSCVRMVWYNLANVLGSLATLLAVAYHFDAVNAKRCDLLLSPCGGVRGQSNRAIQAPVSAYNLANNGKSWCTRACGELTYVRL